MALPSLQLIMVMTDKLWLPFFNSFEVEIGGFGVGV